MTDDVYIVGLDAYLPSRICTVEAAVTSGRYSAERVEIDGFTAVRIEDERGPADMALQAAKDLVGDAEKDAFNTLFLTCIHRHGHKMLWPPASFLQKALGLATCTRIMSINQGCNGAFVAASLAYDLIRCGLPGDHLVLGADRFSGSSFDRFNSDLGTLYGDAACALRLSARFGSYRIRCLVLESEPALEEMYRDPAISTEGAADHDIKSAKRTYLDVHGRGGFNALFVPALRRLRDAVLGVIDLQRQPAEYVVYPNVGAGLSAQLYAGEFADMARRDMWAFGRSIGHTGTSDQFLGLWQLDRLRTLRPGDRVLLIGAGNGLGLAAMVLEKTQA